MPALSLASVVHRLTARVLPWGACCLVLGAAVAALAAEPSGPPNIVFIIADDLGWTDLGCQGSTYYDTPRIDALARGGLRMTSFAMNSNCAPTRAALLSGQYAPRTGMYSVGTLARGAAAERRMRPPENVTELPLDRITLADSLRRAGYVTGMFGKWHLGEQGPHHPSQRGFDEAIASMGRHFNFVTRPAVEPQENEYLADFLTDRAVDFLRRHRDERFFLYLSHFVVHTPIQAKEDVIAKYRDKPEAGGHFHATYAAMIASLDESVGRIMATLDELKLTERTLVVFTSDNGGLGGYDTTEPPAMRRGFTDNKPLRGGKGVFYEGGLRVPFVVRWPGVIPAGAVCDEPAVHVDIYPTLVELAGGQPPANYPLDGASLAAVWREPGKRLPPRNLYWHFPGYLESYVHSQGWRTTPVSVVRSGDWKLLEFLETNRLELYNLRDDLSERRNLAAEQPERTRRLHAELSAWREQIGAAMPTPK